MVKPLASRVKLTEASKTKKTSYPLRDSWPLRRTLSCTSPSGFPENRLAWISPSACAHTEYAAAHQTHPSTTLASFQAPIGPCCATPETSC